MSTSSSVSQRFNPTRVRLKLALRAAVEAHGRELQPHEGSSETVGREGTRPGETVRFNPTRVRLKPTATTDPTGAYEMLQPHEGSSETAVALADEVLGPELQPHEGSSETRPRSNPRLLSSRFNPTRVRLKPAETVWTFEVGEVLQPHEGSSETETQVGDRGEEIQLQPHEGSSETRLLH